MKQSKTYSQTLEQCDKKLVTYAGVTYNFDTLTRAIDIVSCTIGLVALIQNYG